MTRTCSDCGGDLLECLEFTPDTVTETEPGVYTVDGAVRGYQWICPKCSDVPVLPPHLAGCMTINMSGVRPAP